MDQCACTQQTADWFIHYIAKQLQIDNGVHANSVWNTH